MVGLLFSLSFCFAIHNHTHTLSLRLFMCISFSILLSFLVLLPYVSFHCSLSYVSFVPLKRYAGVDLDSCRPMMEATIKFMRAFCTQFGVSFASTVLQPSFIAQLSRGDASARSRVGMPLEDCGCFAICFDPFHSPYADSAGAAMPIASCVCRGSSVHNERQKRVRGISTTLLVPHLSLYVLSNMYMNVCLHEARSSC